MIRKIARPMIASVYIADGVDSLINTSDHVDGAETLIKRTRAMLPREYARRIPRDPELVVRAAGGAKVGAGAALAVGFMPRVSAAILAGLAVPTVLSRHAFWETQEQPERNARRSGFLTNVGLLGGLLITSMDTAGKPGLKWRADKAAVAANKKIHAALPTKSETEKFGESARDWIGDASDKVSEYAHLAQDYVADHKDEWIDTASGAAHKVTDYFQDNKDEWLAAARENAKTARKGLVKAASQAQDRADAAWATAEKSSGRAAKKARKSADKLQQRADDAIVKAQKQIGDVFNI